MAGQFFLGWLDGNNYTEKAKFFLTELNTDVMVLPVSLKAFPFQPPCEYLFAQQTLKQKGHATACPYKYSLGVVSV
ncbi:hypothetical protein HRH25_15965 [Flavisolibacter sp. BT320]|nr:hypothetical protein [Flavisolibacter longurius]